MEGYTCIRGVLASLGKSVPRSTILAYPPSFADPALLAPGAFNASPTSIDAW
jgi:hypothetical protein